MPYRTAKIAAAILALLAGTQMSAAADAARTPLRIEVPVAGNLQFLTLWVALGSHAFEAEGLAPEVIYAATPRDDGQLLLSGKADVTLFPPPMFLGMMAEEKPVVLFASLLANEPINLVVRKDVAERLKLATNDGLRARLQAIHGLKVGLAGEVAPRLRAMFASAGLNADKDIQQIVIDGPNQVQAFTDGRVDALFCHTPFLETLLVNEDALLIADNSGGEVPLLTGGQIHALATTRANVAQKPELIAAVTRAILRAQRLIHSDPKAAVDAIVASGATKLARPLLEKIVAVYAPAVPATPAISLDGIERDASLYPAHPRAPDFARVKASDFVAPEFASQAAK